MAGFPLAITLNANFISNQKEGKLRAVATFIKKGKNPYRANDHHRCGRPVDCRCDHEPCVGKV